MNTLPSTLDVRVAYSPDGSTRLEGISDLILDDTEAKHFAEHRPTVKTTLYGRWRSVGGTTIEECPSVDEMIIMSQRYERVDIDYR